MATCTLCNLEMLAKLSCVPNPVHTASGMFEPVVFGRERRFRLNTPTCGDCGTPKGGFHHRGCDCEECPRCIHQLISCGCDNSESEADDDEGIGVRAYDGVEILALAREMAPDDLERRRIERMIDQAEAGREVHLSLVTADHGASMPTRPAGASAYERVDRVQEQLERLIDLVGSVDVLESLDVTAPLPDEDFDWSNVPVDLRGPATVALELLDRAAATDPFTIEHRTACRRLLATILAIEPDVLRRTANPARFAAGVCWLVAKANHTLGPGRITATAMGARFGVGSTADMTRRLERVLRVPTRTCLYDEVSLGSPAYLTRARRASIMREATAVFARMRSTG